MLWLFDESRRYQTSEVKLYGAWTKHAMAKEKQIADFDQMERHLEYLMSLEKLAREKTELHKRYLETTIAHMRAKVKELEPNPGGK